MEVTGNASLGQESVSTRPWMGEGRTMQEAIVENNAGAVIEVAVALTSALGQ